MEVNFQSPEEFTDMNRTYSALKGADRGYLSELQRYIEQRGANRIPAGQTLAVTITDVDMAGQFEPERGAQFIDIRMVRTIYPPRIDLNYKLTDQNGAVISEGERKLRNQSFDWTVSPVDQHDSLRYEKALIDDFLRSIANEIG